ncbi:MAG: conjugal transfer protein TraL [Candidatus Acidiferrales bacterium]
MGEKIIMANQNGETPETAIHLALQGKGGVGKSLVASILIQYFLTKGAKVHAVDTDPVNHTLAQYRQLEVQCLELLRDGGIDQRGFDVLMERVLTESGTFVVDSGAATFIPLWFYMLENHVLESLRKAGRRLVVHSVVTGGQALADTLSGFNQVAQTSHDRNLVVWLNEYFGLVRQGGAAFAEMAVYKKNQDKVLGSVAIVKRNQDTFGRDIEEMIARKMTFDEALRDAEFSIMAKQRLKIVRDNLFEQLDALNLLQGQKPQSSAGASVATPNLAV